ncbi:hypothetical protein M9Y10_029271 [Tritrichomonas musculus]|uniref:Exostosin GT47 domain-containing protein n=1 Tax=Tritrichomonas musculus TaxID=1915356 RepID=A0ABR2KLN6_9EUKA
MIFNLLISCVFSSKLDLPILRRIAEDDKWPPLRVYIYPIEKFPSRLYKPSENPRFYFENNLADLLKESPIYRSNPNDADLFLVPLPLSSLNISHFSEILSILPELGPFYDRYHGTDHIFIHAQFPREDTAINVNNFVLHQGHIFTSGFAIEGSYVKTWVYAKNLLLPLKPQTKFVDVGSDKKMQIAVDISTDECTERNKEIRNHIAEVLKGKEGYVLSDKKDEALKNMEESAFTLVTACEMEMATQFYDALNALSVPIVLNNVMRFPFESELIDYRKFVLHINESSPESTIGIMEKHSKHLKKMQDHMNNARKMLDSTSKDGGYIWAIAWSLYMKLLAWLPIRRRKIIDNIFNEPNVFVAR